MSLLSQKDRKIVIECLEYYISKLDLYAFDNPHKRTDTQQKKNEIVTLLNWIKLEYFKYEN